jgi:predicted nucleotidyltransferase
MSAASDTQDLARELAIALPQVSPSVVSAYLFGSHAEGRAHTESDVDVGVLLSRDDAPTERERFELRVRIGSELIGQLHRNDVDVVILNDAPPELGRRIVTKGLRVYCRDAEADHAFIRDVQLRAADLDPFLRRTRRIKLAALSR